MIFSSLYYAVFFDLHAPATEICYSILEGCGHLWFLPMLFGCFVAIYVVERLGVNPRLVLALAIVAAILRPTLPLRLAHASYYFMFFYIGYGLSRNTLNFMKPTYRLWPILCALGVYILTFALDEGIKSVDFCASERLRYYALNALHIAISVSGLLVCYWSAHYFVVGRHTLPWWMIRLSTYCYGVYVYHQFFLRYMYYETGLPYGVSCYALPWIGMSLTLALSLTATHLTLKTRFGRFLIG